ncbi:MAG: FkbM family methyltransferase [Wenzhouxiangella sp.]|nr:FkbM family methyltransferase [Wenzhouxiangella sp.]TVR98359.1 MAG: FkbM family methyltransferase [Wenzhouxiangellaceae bacterium]
MKSVQPGRWRHLAGLLRSLWLYRRPGRLAGLKRLYRPLVPAGGLVFDIGAHLGDRTRAFRALGARVVALEPQPGLMQWLERFHGRDKGVTLLGLAVGAQPGHANLRVDPANPSVATLSDDWIKQIRERNTGFARVDWDGVIEVELTTLDALIERYGRPDFCKIDVEGFEVQVLAGLSRALPALSVEFVAGTLERTRACVQRLEQLADYRYNAVRGERREVIWPHWRTADAVIEWLDDGADSIASGDIYARRATLDQ